MGQDSTSKILIVDDSDAMLFALGEGLSTIGLECVTASSGEEALERLQEHEFGVAILDVDLPGMDGFATAEKLKSSFEGRDISVVFLTGAADRAKVFEGYAAGGVDFLDKPVDLEILQVKVKALLDLHRANKALHRELVEKNRLNEALEQYSSRVAHDLRNPLSAIRAAVELAKRPLDEKKKEDLLDLAARQAGAALQLITDLLDLAKASGIPKTEAVPLKPLIDECLADKRVEIEELEVDGATVIADPRVLRQAIVNLLENSVRYASIGGPARVAIEAAEEPQGCRLCISDRGPGIPEEDAKHIFEPFRRGSEHSDQKGTGLGLAIVGAMAEAHGGRAWYEPREGGGSRFLIFLPATVPSAN